MECHEKYECAKKGQRALKQRLVFGSILARDTGDAVQLLQRCDATASKPAPTKGLFMCVEVSAFHRTHRQPAA